MSSATISVSTVGLGGTDRSVMKVAMGLLEKSGCAVQILEPGDTSGKIVLLDADTEEGRRFLQEFQTSRSQTLVLLAAETQDTYHHTILKKPLRVQTLKDVVHDIHQESHKTFSLPGKAAPVAAPVAAPAPALAPFNAENNLFFVLLAARQEQKVLQVFSPPFPALYVNAPSGVVAASGTRDTLRKMVRTFSGRMTVTKLSPSDFEILSRGQIINPLSQLLWSAALFGSQGQLIQGHSLDAPVRLKAWPNLSRMDFDPDHMTMSSVLARHPMSLKQLQEKTGGPLERVIGFYNAAWVSDLLEFAPPDNSADQAGPAVEPKKVGLLAKIARRLNLDAKFTSPG